MTAEIAPLQVGFVLTSGREELLADEEREALAWLRGVDGIRVQLVALPSLARGESPVLRNVAVLWWHGAWAEGFPEVGRAGPACDGILDFLRRGGGLMVSLMAAEWPSLAGIEPSPPDVRVAGVYGEADGPKRGFHAFLGHPLFDPFRGGVYVAAPIPGEPRHDVAYTGAHVPHVGRVIGVERSLIAIDPSRRTVIEWTFGRGRVLAIGAHVLFGDASNPFRAHLEAFAEAALRYVATPGAGNAGDAWTFAPPRIEHVDERSDVEARIGAPAIVPPPDDTTLSGPGRDVFFDLAGTRLLLMGLERGGVSEAWVHPVRVLRDLRLGLLEDDSGRIAWLDSLEPDVDVRPEAIVRRYRLRAASIVELLVASPDRPAAIAQVRVESREVTSLLVTFRIDLRLMWPYPENALAPLAWTWDANLRAIVVRDARRRFAAVVGADRAPDERLAGPYAGIVYENESWRGLRPDPTHLTVGLRYATSGTPLRLVVAGGGPTDTGEAQTAFADAHASPERVRRTASERVASVVESRARIETPDRDVDGAFRCSVLGTERFLAGRAEEGLGLLAGFGFTRPGWNSGRPGYAWYFGRDAAWCGFALDDVGAHESVRATLEFLARWQDLTGKIPHEVTTSGVAHDDAADSTPLWLALLGRHVRASGDVDLARKLWPRARKALAFCESTDTDGDGLIENSGVGHGWIEGGALFGSHVETYLVGCWARALEEVAGLAELVGDGEIAGDLRGRFARTREALNGEFWNEDAGTYHLGKYRDGSFNAEPTALVAVPILFGLADAEKADAALDQLAGSDFTTDWGVRLVSERSPHFDAKGYHLGSVWPLFTGWVSLAEYRCHRPAQGFAHWMMNLLSHRAFSRGVIQEVFHGMRFAPAGICPHQAWSQTMAIEPAIEGMLGFVPDAPHDRLTLAPHLPPHWPTFAARGLRVGDRVIDFEATVAPGRLELRLSLRSGAPLRVHLSPALGPGARVDRTSPAASSVRDTGLDVHVDFEFELSRETKISIEHSGEVALFPIVPRPTPGAVSAAPKIVSFRPLDADRFRLELDARVGTESVVELGTKGRSITTATGAAIERGDEGLWRLSVRAADGPRELSRSVVELRAPRN
ncbi:MAG: hypothetical protein HY292_13980 [Planctomycetes bacterium]|nr:hypothetical protein [Planctomycetota bacterium]